MTDQHERESDQTTGSTPKHQTSDENLNKHQRQDATRDLSTLNSRRDSYTHIPRYYSPPGHHPSERTPLLDPDDPAVSPLNLRGVQLLRGVLWLMIVVTCLWALLLFINCFASIPFITIRTSGYFELDLTIMSLITLLLAVLLFTVPSGAELSTGYFLTASLALIFLLMIAIPYMRHTYGVSGIFSGAWALASVGVSLVITPYVVKWGKDYEEERLTGRLENRRTLTEWFKLSFSLILLLVLVVIPGMLLCFGFLLNVYDTARLLHGKGAATEGIFVPIVSKEVAGFRFIHSHDYSVYIECTPENEHEHVAGTPPHIPSPPPIVLLEADDSTSAQSFYNGWIHDLYEDKKVSQVCFWNRPGRGFSDVAPSPFSLDASTHALTIALNRILSPNTTDTKTFDFSDEFPFHNRTFALVSHGVGGLYSRAFAARHSKSIHSLFLIDTLHEDLVHKFMGLPSRGFSLWLKGMISPFAIRRQLSWLLHHKGPESRYLSDATNGKFAFRTNPNELKASLQEQITALNGVTNALIKNANDVLMNTRIPLAVVSSAQSIIKYQQYDWRSLQRKLTKVTSNNVAWDIMDGPHELWTDVASKLQLQKLLVNLLQEKTLE